MKKNPQISPPTTIATARAVTHGRTAPDSDINFRGFAYSQMLIGAEISRSAARPQGAEIAAA